MREGREEEKEQTGWLASPSVNFWGPQEAKRKKKILISQITRHLPSTLATYHLISDTRGTESQLQSMAFSSQLICVHSQPYFGLCCTLQYYLLLTPLCQSPLHCTPHPLSPNDNVRALWVFTITPLSRCPIMHHNPPSGT